MTIRPGDDETAGPGPAGVYAQSPPPPYDYPHRVSTPEAAAAELARLNRARHQATGETARRYLARRIGRCHRVIRWHQQQARPRPRWE